MNEKLMKNSLIFPVIFFLVLIFILDVLDIRRVFEPLYLLPLLNTIFLSLIPFIMAYYSAKTFLNETARLPLLFLSCGMVALGLGGLVSGWFIGKTHGPNITITIYNSSVFLCSVFHASGAVITFTFPGWNPLKKRKLTISLLYMAIILILGVVYYGAINKHIPDFIRQGDGPTLPGKYILGITIFLFGLSSLIFGFIYMERRQKLLLWYARGLALIAIGLSGVFLQKAVGTPIGWAGRFSQYTGVLYILCGIISFYKSVRSGEYTFETALASIFSESEANYKALISSATDGIVLTNRHGRVLIWNNAAEKLTGYTETEAVGSLLKELVFNNEFPENPEPGIIENLMRTKAGGVFPSEISISKRNAPSGTVTTFIIKDITGRNHAENMLRESEEIYRSLFENMLNGCAYCRMHFDENGSPVDFTYLTVNRSFATLTGLTDVTGRRITEIIPGVREKDQEVLEICGRVSKTGEPERFEMFIKSVQQWYWISVYSPKTGYFAAVFDVITDRKLADELRDSEEKYRVLFNNEIYAICILENESMKFLDVNDAFIRLYGYSRDELISGMTNYDVTAEPAELAKSIEWIKHYGSLYTPLRYHRKKDGTMFPIEIARGEYDWKGRKVFFTMIHDISDRVAVEKKLYESEQRYRNLFENAGTGIIIIDINGVYLMANNKIAGQFGMKREDLIGRSMFEFLSRDAAQKYLELNRELINTGGVREYEESFILQGVEKKFYIIDQCLADSEGRNYAVQSSSIDITDRKIAEDKIQKLLAEKELILKEVHHRIKNNMNTIKGLLSLQISAEQNPSAAESLRDAEGRIQSMIMLYDKLYCSQNYRDYPVKEYLHQLAGEIVSSFPNSGKVTVITDIDDFILGIKFLSPLGIIVNEIITNSMKYAFPGGKTGMVSISASSENGHVTIVVQDDGVGISESAGPGKSEGFGLELVKMLMDQIGGSVQIGRDNGTKFIMEFDL